MWTGYWWLAAVLFVLPDNRTTTSVQSAIVGMADGQPGWYARFLTDLGNLFSTSGTQTAWILAIVAVVIGVGPLVARRPGVFLAPAPSSPSLLWIAGQGLIGNLFTGSDTDPNTGPVIILLAAAMTPTVIATRAEWRSPAGEILRRIPAVGVLGVVGLGAALAMAASYPAATAESANVGHGRHGDGRQRQRRGHAGVVERVGHRGHVPARTQNGRRRSPASTWPTRR